MTIETSEPVINEEQLDTKEKKKEGSRLEIVNKLAELGIDKCPEEIIERLLIIGEHSGFNIDSEMICEGFGNVLSFFESKNLFEKPLTLEQKRDGLLAAFLHDIGKSGPESASLLCSLSVIKLFSAKVKKEDSEKYKTVKDVLSDFFPEQYDEMATGLGEAGITPETLMRDFWDKHAWWTNELLQKYPDTISDRVDLIASSHHISEGVNPRGISEEEVPLESMVIGALEKYVDFLEERILMILDKYQAALVRPENGTHESAMAYIRNVFKKYKEGSTTFTIIETINEMVEANSLFPKSGSKYSKKQ